MTPRIELTRYRRPRTGWARERAHATALVVLLGCMAGLIAWLTRGF